MTIVPGSPAPAIHVMAYGRDVFVEKRLAHASELREMIGKYPVLWVNVDGLGELSVLVQLAEIAVERVQHRDDLGMISALRSDQDFSTHTRNDSPQPQRSFSRGLWNLKPSFRPSRTKSSSVPSM